VRWFFLGKMQNVFVRESGSNLTVSKSYEIWGPLFFGSISAFNQKFDVKNDPDAIEIDFVESRVSDHSAIEAIFNLVNKYNSAGKTIKLKHLSQDCKVLLYKSSPLFKDVIIEAIDDPRYHLARKSRSIYQRAFRVFAVNYLE